jgi:glutaredoxin 2
MSGTVHPGCGNIQQNAVGSTVPVLALADGTIIDESRDIMLWALSLCDPEHWQTDDSATEINRLLNDNDYDFNIC